MGADHQNFSHVFTPWSPVAAADEFDRYGLVAARRRVVVKLPSCDSVFQTCVILSGKIFFTNIDNLELIHVMFWRWSLSRGEFCNGERRPFQECAQIAKQQTE